MTRQTRQYSEVEKAFAGLKPRFEELWDGICEVEVETGVIRESDVVGYIRPCQH